MHGACVLYSGTLFADEGFARVPWIQERVIGRIYLFVWWLCWICERGSWHNSPFLPAFLVPAQLQRG